MKWELLHKVFFDREALTSDEKLQLDELQLWWEKELSAISWDEKKIQLIKKLILEYLKMKLKLLLKVSDIPIETKQELLQWITKI